MKALDLSKEGKAMAGIDLLKEVIEERKDVDIAYYHLAILYKEQRRLKEALEILKLGLENVPSSYEIFSTYINYLILARQNDEVIKTFSEMNIREMEHDPAIWMNLGIAYSNKGEFTKALDAFERALSLDNRYPEIFNNLGNVYLSLSLKTKDQKTFRKSLENFKKAIELDPDYPAPYNGLGMAYRVNGNVEGAIYCWEKALELSPNYGRVLLFNLGLAYLEKGEKAKALDYLKKYKEIYYRFLPPNKKSELDTLIQNLEKDL
jgi:Flp pilus assembly protein TadD